MSNYEFKNNIMTIVAATIAVLIPKYFALLEMKPIMM